MTEWQGKVMIGLGSDKNREIQTAAHSSDAKHKYRKAALVQVWPNSSAPKGQNYKIRGKDRKKDRAAQLQKYKQKNEILKDATRNKHTNKHILQTYVVSTQTLLHSTEPNTMLRCFNCNSILLQQQKYFPRCYTLFSVWWCWPKIEQIDWNDTCVRAVSCNFCCQVAKLRLRKPQQSTHWKILFMRVRSQIETGSLRCAATLLQVQNCHWHCIAILSLEGRYPWGNVFFQ